LYSPNVAKSVQELEEVGLKPAYGLVSCKEASAAAYKDPDGFVVYIIQFKMLVLELLVKYAKWKHGNNPPWLFHWTINVENSAQVNSIREKIGFKSMSDQTKDQVLNDLLPAFGLEEKDTEIEHIRLASLKDDHFVATTMEWSKPQSCKTGQEVSNSMCISVANIQEVLKEANEAGMIVKEVKAKMTMLPFYGDVQVGLSPKYH